MNKQNIKDIRMAITFGLIFSLVLCFVRFDADCEQIRGSVLRLHVLANSDSDEDQTLKLTVRDKLLVEADSLFTDTSTEEEAICAAKDNLPQLQQVAEEVILENGYDYGVTVEIGEAYFNTRVYDTFTLPAGNYEAVRVLIGEAKGKNWWCVMFPPVCVPAAMADTNIGDVLDENQTDIVENSNSYEIRFKTVEVFEKAKNYLSKFFK
ncbi:MAG: stage II sporulation protein R [Oscillospiraceae bacterium]|nr:stage II sporulation protein R [Oscillospiraceae bacterium]